MNYHPKAFERGWRYHKEAWFDEETFKAAKAIKDAYAEGEYKGNAHTALVDLIRRAHAEGKAGQGEGQVAESWAYHILNVCRTMEWYDPETLPPEELKHRMDRQGTLATQGYTAPPNPEEKVNAVTRGGT